MEEPSGGSQTELGIPRQVDLLGNASSELGNVIQGLEKRLTSVLREATPKEEQSTDQVRPGGRAPLEAQLDAIRMVFVSRIESLAGIVARLEI